MFTPLPANSAPFAAPSCWISVGSQVAAAFSPSGKAVTPPLPSPTPDGPSSMFSGLMHRLGMALTWPMYDELPSPEARVTSSDWSMVLSTCWTRWATGAVEPTQGQTPLPPLPLPPVTGAVVVRP